MNAEVIRNEHTIVRAAGEIDLSNVDEFSSALGEAGEIAPGGFIIDLSEAAYIDSAGVQAILSVYMKVRERGGSLALVLGNERIRLVMGVVHLEQLPGMFVCDTMQDAEGMLPNSEDAP